MRKKTILVAAILSLCIGRSWASSCHSGGAGGHGVGHGASDSSHWSEDHNYERIQKIEKRKMKIEARLRDPNLKAAKRAKLEKELENLKKP